MHHDEGKPGQPSFHSINGKYGKSEFESTFATEIELVSLCEEWINLPYITGLSAADLQPEEMPISLEWAAEHQTQIIGEIADEQTAQPDDRDTDTDADMESIIGDEPDGEETVQRFDTQVCIDVVHYRYRLADPDGLSVKAAIDGIHKAGILIDDSAKEIEAISHRQIKIPRQEAERTTFTITEVM
jgi:hypothetical protein